MDDEPRLLMGHTVSPDRTAELLDAFRARPELPADAFLTADTPEESLRLVADADGLVGWRIPEEWFDAAADLRWIQSLTAGVDFLPIDRIEAGGIVLTSAAGVHAEPIAEQVLAYVLNFERGLVEMARHQARGVWERPRGGELRGKTLGVIGVGAIGSRVAELGSAFGMETVGTKRDTSEVPEAIDDLLPADEYHAVLRRADYVVLACPLTEATEGMIGRPEFRLMSDDDVLVNVARGAVVDQSALVRALQYRTIRGAALDVFEEEPLPADSPLWDLSNVILTPHMAGTSPHQAERIAEIFATNYVALVNGDPDSMVNRVV
jgi:phosphoglycerate dehydrogenase-like enzyme